MREHKFIKALNGFFYSPYYMLTVALLMAFSNVFAMEFPVFYCYMAFCVFITLFSPDCFPVIPMFCCGYMLFSANNNPASNYEGNFLTNTGNLIQFIIIAVVAFLVLAARLVYELIAKNFKPKSMPKLTYGFLALGLVYIIAGIFSDTYTPKSSLFGLLEIVCLCLTYFYFYYTVDFSKRKPDEVMLMFTAIGFGLLIEIVGMYAAPNVVERIIRGNFFRSLLKTGWGVYNNVGGMMALMLPAPVYLAIFGKHKYFWTFVASTFFVGIVLTQSRGAMIVSVFIFVICLAIMFIYSTKKSRIIDAIIISSLTIAVLAFVFLNDVFDHLRSLIQIDVLLDGTSRFGVFKEGLTHFTEYPIFGKGFYSGLDRDYLFGANNLPENSFLPPRYHNTVIQLLASGGIVALSAYVYHRIQTVKLVFKDRTPFKTFMGLSVLSLLLTSMLDCHFFNFGPGLTYGVMLLFIEMIPSEKTLIK